MRWFRMHTATVDNRKIQKLPLDRFRDWVNLMCIAGESSGILPSNEDIAWRLHRPEAEMEDVLAFMFAADLIDVIEVNGSHFYKMHDWDKWQYVSDDSSERVRQHRARKAPKDETLHETGVKRYKPVSVTRSEDRIQIQNTDKEVISVGRETTSERKGRPPDEDLESIQKLLQEFCEIRKLDFGPPDKDICLKVHEALNGHSIPQFQQFLGGLIKRNKQPVKSYAWFVTLTLQHFRQGNANGAIRKPVDIMGREIPLKAMGRA